MWLNYASGDHDPGDGVQQRFDPLFGATFAFYGYSGYFNWQNIVEPSIRFSAQPTEKLRTEIIYRGYALASAKDAWVRGLGLIRREPAAASSDRNWMSASRIPSGASLRSRWCMPTSSRENSWRTPVRRLRAILPTFREPSGSERQPGRRFFPPREADSLKAALPTGRS